MDSAGKDKAPPPVRFRKEGSRSQLLKVAASQSNRSRSVVLNEGSRHERVVYSEVNPIFAKLSPLTVRGMFPAKERNFSIIVCAAGWAALRHRPCFDGLRRRLPYNRLKKSDYSSMEKSYKAQSLSGAMRVKDYSLNRREVVNPVNAAPALTMLASQKQKAQSRIVGRKRDIFAFANL